MLAAVTTASALPPVNLSSVAGGNAGFVINGIDQGDQAGFSVSGAGDVNGDGLADVIVGAFLAAGNTGESYVVFGKTSTTAVDLSDVAAGTGGGFVINGDDVGDFAGRVSAAGDVNGDGLADVIVGAYGAAAFAGESYVVFGKASTTAVNLLTVAAGAGGGFAINGDDVGDRSGFSISGAGDVNGDGLADLVVGAKYAYGGASYSGESYVVFGKASTAAVSLAGVAAGVGGFVIGGIDFGDLSAFSVSGAGDVNGDGLADVIVGAPYSDPGGVQSAGESYVVFGKVSTTAVDLANVVAGNGGFVITGAAGFDYSGFSVSGAGDVNGDGLADVIVGATEFFVGAGESYVVFGKATTTAVSLADVVAGTGGGFVINGIDGYDKAGFSVSGAGDVDGDGLADVVVGAHDADPGGAGSAGEGYVVFGKTSTTAVSLADVVAGVGGFVMNGIDAYDFAGVSVSGAGDINGDCLADVIVGARAADPGGVDAAGESYVVFSPAATGPNINEVGIFRNSLWFLDTTGDNQAGAGDDFFVFGLPTDTPVRGDWNGDGTDNVGIYRNGLWFLDLTGDNQAGAGDVFFEFGLPADTPVVGDWNGDGTDEIGIFRNGLWFLDLNGDNQAGAEDTFFVFGLSTDIPVVGNWDGAVGDEVGIYRNGLWFLDLTGDNQAGAGDTFFGFGLPADIPVVGDWNGLPGDEVGIYRNGLWFLDTSGDDQAGAGDAFFVFGLPTDTPVVGGSCP